MRLRLLSATVAVLALAGGIAVAPVAPKPADAATATATAPMLVGLTSPWVLENGRWVEGTARDEAQIGGGFRAGVISSFFQWDTNPTSLVNWANWVRSRGAAPVADLYPPTSVSLGAIASGSQDAALKKLAVALKGYNHPFMFRLFPEMNGQWESYAPGRNGQTGVQFVAAWRRVYNVFAAAGATDVQFVWNPNRLQTGQRYSYKALWPGAGYIDWVALDGYAWQDAAHGQEGPYTMFKPSVDAIRALTTTKPLMISEAGVAPYAGKATWLKTHLSAHQALGAKISVYFNQDKSSTGDRNWRIDSAPNATAQLSAMRSALAPTSMKYYGRLSTASIDHLIWSGAF